MTTVSRLPGMPSIQNAMRSEGREGREAEKPERGEHEAGKAKGEKRRRLELYFKTQPVLTALKPVRTG